MLRTWHLCRGQSARSLFLFFADSFLFSSLGLFVSRSVLVMVMKQLLSAVVTRVGETKTAVLAAALRVFTVVAWMTNAFVRRCLLLSRLNCVSVWALGSCLLCT